jgi:putative peptidoglycan lipid II flippase
LLWRWLHRAGVYRRQPGWGRLLRQVAVAAAGLVAVVLALRGLWPDWSGWSWWARGWRRSVLVGAGAGAYLALLLVQGLRLRHLRG